MVGSLAGAAASKRVTEAHKGNLSMIFIILMSVMAKDCLTVRLASQAETLCRS